MSLTEIKLIVGLCITGAVILGSIIYLIVMGCKKHWFKQLYEELKVAIKDAEATGKSGAEKKQFVTDRMIKKCDELGIPYKIIKKLIDKAIDQTIDAYNIFVK